MKIIIKLITLITIMMPFVAPFTAQAQNCGKIKGNKIVTYGGLSCSKAKYVYEAYKHGHIPAGWTCGLSAGACNFGKQGFTFRFN